jgi:hypothetical protein
MMALFVADERSQKSEQYFGSQEEVAHLMQIAGNEGAEPSDFVSGFEEIGHHHRHHAGGGCRPDSIVRIFQGET